MMYESTYYNPNYLAHYGVMGMRWGVRHFKKKYGGNKVNYQYLNDYNTKVSGIYSNAGKTLGDAAKYARENRKTKIEDRSLTRKDASRLSDKEIESMIARINKENTLNRLLTEREQAGKINYDRILRGIGTGLKVVGSAAALIATYYAIKEKKANIAKDVAKTIKENG